MNRFSFSQKLRKAVAASTVFFGILALRAQVAYAQITNPVIDSAVGANVGAAESGQSFTRYFVYFWRVLMVIGGLAVVITFMMGAFDWITAGGEKGKVEGARQKIINSIIGMVILAGSFAVLQFIGNTFGFDLLNPNIAPLTP